MIFLWVLFPSLWHFNPNYDGLYIAFETIRGLCEKLLNHREVNCILSKKKYLVIFIFFFVKVIFIIYFSKRLITRVIIYNYYRNIMCLFNKPDKKIIISSDIINKVKRQTLANHGYKFWVSFHHEKRREETITNLFKSLISSITRCKEETNASMTNSVN